MGGDGSGPVGPEADVDAPVPGSDDTAARRVAPGSRADGQRIRRVGGRAAATVWAVWTLSTAAAWGLRPVLTWLLHHDHLDAFLANEAMSFTQTAEVPSFVACGALLGLAQGWLVSPLRSRAPSWTGATAIGWGLTTVTPVVGPLVGGLLLGALQWRVLRAAIPSAGAMAAAWIVASGLGWQVGTLAGERVTYAWEPRGLSPVGFGDWALPMAAGFALAGAGVGTVLGAVLATARSARADAAREHRGPAPRTSGERRAGGRIR